MRKKYFFGIGILLICLAGWGAYKIFRPHGNVEGEDAVATLTAMDIYREFSGNESRANQKWLGKVVEITGKISSITEAGKYISLNLVGTADGGVNCSVLKNDFPAGEKLNKGDAVTVKGKCTGFLMDVNLVDCIIKK
jgi:tRNA_anti-like